MGLFAFAKEFEPVVRKGDNVEILGEYYRILHVEPVQERIINLLTSDRAGLTSLSANGSSNDRTKMIWLDQELKLPATPENPWLGQWRIEPLDDILIEVGHPEQSKIMYGTESQKSYIFKRNPRHVVTKQITSADTDTDFWTVTNNSDAGKRVAKIKKIIAYNQNTSSASEIRIGDGSGAIADAKIAFTVGTSAYEVLSERELPEAEFLSKITAQASAVNVVLTIELVEETPCIFDSQAREIFTLSTKDVHKIPYVRLINPLSISQSKARFVIAGYKYMLEKLPSKPEKWTWIPIGTV